VGHEQGAPEVELKMKWLKLDTNNLSDEKIEGLLAKHGPEGYGVYVACISLIAGKLSEDNPSVQLKHSSELIAHKLYTTQEKVEAVIATCLELRLFVENDGGRECPALWKRIDDNTRRGLRRKSEEIPPDSGATPDKLRSNSGATPDKVLLEEKRLEENRREEKRVYAEGVTLTPAEHEKLVLEYGKANTKAAIDTLSSYKLEKGKKYKSDYGAILHWAMRAAIDKSGVPPGRKPAPYVRKVVHKFCKSCGAEYWGSACDCGWSE
jgi:hypothetical protein